MNIALSSLIGMWVYIGAVLVTIFAIVWIFGHRIEMNLSTIILGFIAYFVFDTILLGLFFDNLIVGTLSQGLYATVTTNPSAFVPYYAVTRGIFYMLAMYIATRMSMRADTNGGGFAIGIGFVAGFGLMNKSQGAWTVFQGWRTAVQINKLGGVDGYIALAESEGYAAAELDSLRVSAMQLCNTDIAYYLVNTVELLLTLAVLFALAVVIHLAVTRRAPYYFLPVSIVLFIVVMLPAALYLAGFLPGRWLYDLLLVLCCGGCIALAAVIAKRFMHNEMKW